MKTTKLLSLTITALVALSQPTWARGFGGGGGGHFGGGGFSGGHFGGGFSGGHLGGARVGGLSGGGFRAAPYSFGGARFSGRNFGGPAGSLRYYTGVGRMPAAGTSAPSAQVNRSISSNARRSATTVHPQNVAASPTRQSIRPSNQQMSRAAVQRAVANHKVFARHDGNWHRDWDRHRAHFDHGHVFVFVNGFWWGLYPWDYYPYYGYGYGDYPYDSYGYPYDYGDYPYDGTDYSTSQPYSYYTGYAPSGTNGNGVVSAVQSKLASLGYYHGAIDGTLGDETEAALARYQEDQDLSVTGTVTAATLHALGLQ